MPDKKAEKRFKFGDKVHSANTNLIITKVCKVTRPKHGIFYMAHDKYDGFWYRDDFKRGWKRRASDR